MWSVCMNSKESYVYKGIICQRVFGFQRLEFLLVKERERSIIGLVVVGVGKCEQTKVT